ncbi:MAG TPA: hypothetical protein VK508_02795 [Cyclobacteriaceae bacterium]|nr:hypothetical protein [Cyclobacteriaceae bacterium]
MRAKQNIPYGAFCNTGSFHLVIAFSLLVTAAFAQDTDRSRAVNVNHFDSLKLPNATVPELKLQPDSLFADNLAKAEQAAAKFSHKIDSLQSLNLPTEKYKRKLDSLSGSLKNKIIARNKFDSAKLKFENRTSGIRNVQDSLTHELEDRKLALQKTIDQKSGFLDSLTNGLGVARINRSLPVAGVPNAQLRTDKLKLPDDKISGKNALPGNNVNLPANPLADVKADIKPDIKIDNPLTDINQKVKDVQDKSKSAVQDNDIVNGASKVKGELEKVNGAARKIETYTEEIKDVKENGLSQADDLTKDAEKRATEQIMKQDAMKELQTQNNNASKSTNMLKQYQDMLASVKDKNGAIGTVKGLASEHVVDHFAGKEDKLKAGIAQLDKLKKKYKNIPDSRYLPKRAPNEMKDKPFRERIVPGISLQLFKADRTALDVAPYVAYKLSGRFRPGIGVSWRAAVWLKHPWMKKDEVYGYRLFNDLKLYSSFFLHTEGEWLHYSEGAKARYKFPVDKDFANWQFRFNAGLFRTYPISKRINGQFQVLYNVADLKRFPQNRNTSLRFGFEYKLQPKKKK